VREHGTVRATSIEELQVYQKALAAAHDVSAILKRPCFRRDTRLHDQLAASSDSCPSLISDGFAQSTDRFFAQLCHRSMGEAKETRTHLIVARGRDYITDEELERICAKYEEVEKMLASLIRYLQRSDWKNRGRGNDLE
jgi:four helix bundle protein